MAAENGVETSLVGTTNLLLLSTTSKQLLLSAYLSGPTYLASHVRSLLFPTGSTVLIKVPSYSKCI